MSTPKRPRKPRVTPQPALPAPAPTVVYVPEHKPVKTTSASGRRWVNVWLPIPTLAEVVIVALLSWIAWGYFFPDGGGNVDPNPPPIPGPGPDEVVKLNPALFEIIVPANPSPTEAAFKTDQEIRSAAHRPPKSFYYYYVENEEDVRRLKLEDYTSLGLPIFLVRNGAEDTGEVVDKIVNPSRDDVLAMIKKYRGAQ
jgi:hypothetical protein